MTYACIVCMVCMVCIYYIQAGGGLPDTCMVPRTYEMLGQVQVFVSGPSFLLKP